MPTTRTPRATKDRKTRAAPKELSLYQRLLIPHDLCSGNSMEPAAFESEAPSEAPQCIAWLVLASSSKATEWGRMLLKAVRADKSWKTQERSSSLAGDGARVLGSPDLGRASVNIESPESGWGAEDVTSFTSLVVVLVDKRDKPIGYTDFDLRWSVDRFEDTERTRTLPLLAVEIGDVWIRPGQRGKGLSGLMVEALVAGVFRQLLLLEQSTKWQSDAPFRVQYGADVYSESGEEFLVACRNAHALAREFDEQRVYLREANIEVEVRW